MKFGIKGELVKKRKKQMHRRKKVARSRTVPNNNVAELQKIEQLEDKLAQEGKRENERLFAALVIWPILWGAIFYLLCKLGIFCITDLFGVKHMPRIQSQVLELEGDRLAISQGNSVDLSGLRDVYQAGAGLELVANKVFKLEETGVTPGTYGGSNQVPIITIDKYGRITFAGTAPISAGSFNGIRTINGSYGPHINIGGQEHRIIVTTTGSDIQITTPQDIDTTSTPMFAGLHLTGGLYDNNDSLGNVGYVLVSTGNGVRWVQASTIINDHDEQTLSWDSSTFDLSIDNGNTVNLGSLAVWKQDPIGGYYSTDVVTPRDSDVQRITLEHTGWGLTEIQVKNEDNTNNYSGAVLSLKGSGPDYTNNMFFAKLGDNYYVPSWAGKGVVSTDQPLIIASVKSHDAAHPNNNPYIMFQTGGYYTAPVDRMILDANGNLGISDFSPDEKLTVAGNIKLSSSSSARLYSENHELLIGGNNQPVRMFSSSHVRLGVDSNDNLAGRVWVGTNRDPTSFNANKLFLVVSSSNRVAPTAFVRYSNNAAGPVALYYKARGMINYPTIVQAGDVLGGYNSLAYNGHGGTGWQLVAQLRHRVDFVDNDDNVIPYVEFKHRQPGGAYRDVARMLYDGRFGIGNTDPEYTLDLDPLNDKRAAINIRPSDKGNPGSIRFEDNNRTNAVELSAPNDIYHSYSLFLPPDQGNQYEVMYNNGTGSLLWDTVEHLLSINVGAHAILYSDGTNVVGDSNHLYWDWQNNRLGISTTNPQVPLEIDVGNGVGLIIRKTTASGTARLVVASDSLPSIHATRVEITNDSVFGTWYNSTYWLLSRDLWGSGSPGLKLGGNSGMWYKLGAAGGSSIPQYSLIFTTNNTHRAIITRDGNVGVGTMNPGALFQVGEAGDGTYAIANDWQTFSDRNLKDKITPLNGDILNKVLSLQPVSFVWKNDSTKKKQYGFIAQDVEKIFPNIVSKTRSGLYSVSYTKLVPLIVRALRSLKDDIYTLLYGTKEKPGILKTIEIVGQRLRFKLESVFEKGVVFMQSVTFRGNIVFENNNIAGTAVIAKGKREVTVVFSQPLSDVPVVVVTPYSDYVEFRVSKRDKSSFTISVSKAVDAPIEFGWHAFVVRDKK